MTKPVYSIDPDASSDRAKAQMKQRDIHHLVVMKDHRVLGVVSDRDLVARAVPEFELTVSDLMTNDVVVATPDMTLREAAELLRGHNIGCLPVVDGKELVGIVTTSDLLEHIARGTRSRRARA